jgi:hypothetical protein
MPYKNKEKKRAYQDRYRAEHREEERAYRRARRIKLLAAVEILKQLGIEL